MNKENKYACMKSILLIIIIKIQPFYLGYTVIFS